MNFNEIMFYLIRAVKFAFIVTLFYIAIRIIYVKMFNKEIHLRKEAINIMFLFYICSLLQITVIRSGISTIQTFRNFNYESVSLEPFVNTTYQMNNGWWAFVYPVLGNIIWFIPFGFFLPLVIERDITFKNIFFYSLVFSSLIELMQLIFQSGISDIDDIIFNVVGGLVGFKTYLMIKYYRNKKNKIKAD